VVFNKPGSNDFDQVINVDLRHSLAQLREQISHILNCSPDSFKIYKDGELKDLSKLLMHYGFRKGTELIINVGKPLLPKEFLFKVFSWIEDFKAPNDPVAYVGDAILNEDWPMSQVKAEIGILAGLSPNQFRLRDRLGTRLTNVYVDTMTLRQTCKGISDFKEIVIQRIFHDEVLTEDHLLLNVVIFNPLEISLSSAREIGLLKSATIEEAKFELSRIFEIPFEHLRITHPLAFQLKEINTIPGMDWDGFQLPDNATLSGKPWLLKHGEYLAIKDNRIQDKTAKKADDKPERPKTPPARDEPKFKIYTAEERKENERKRAEAEAKAKEDEEKAREEAVRRIAEKNAQSQSNKNQES
jgi:hypothetical protein